MDEPTFRVLNASGHKVGEWPVSALNDERFFEHLQSEHGAVTANIISGEDKGLEIWP